jgi:hypothetical protein
LPDVSEPAAATAGGADTIAAASSGPGGRAINVYTEVLRERAIERCVSAAVRALPPVPPSRSR